MPLPTMPEVLQKHSRSTVPVMTRADVERQRAEREKWLADMEEEDKKRDEADNSRHAAEESRSNIDGGAEEGPRVLADITRPVQSIYGSLKSAKKRKRETDVKDEPQPHKVKSGASSLSPLHSTDTKENGTPSAYAPAKKGPRKTDASYTSVKQVDTRQLATTAWYRNINMKDKFTRSDLIRIAGLTGMIERYVKAMKSGSDIKRRTQELRDMLHQMELFKFLSGVIIKKSKVLEDQGLPAIFDNQEGIDFPFDIRADALALYNRWIVGDIDGHLLRGIKTEKSVLESGKKRTAHRLEPGFVKVSSNVMGNNGLVNGQWWPSRLCLMRDGAHGEVEAGISGQIGRGAFSVVVSGGGYADDDRGDVIKYCGTESDSSAPTKNTNLMLEAEAKNNEIRLMRSEKKESRYAPKKGIRYDGLYVITGHEVLNEATGMYRFNLERCPGQDPIRYQGVEAKPNEYELREFASIREKLAGMA